MTPYRAPALVDDLAERAQLVHRAAHVTSTNPTRTVLVDGKPVTECVECGERTQLQPSK
jgi:hypothetical protein